MIHNKAWFDLHHAGFIKAGKVNGLPESEQPKQEPKKPQPKPKGKK
jgi:hypothetical protein